MSAFHKIIANVRSALASRPDASGAHALDDRDARPYSPAARRAELIAQFAGELDRVGGRFDGVVEPSAAPRHVLTIAQQVTARSVVIGRSITLDSNAIAKELARHQIAAILPGQAKGSPSHELREHLANCDLGVIEADYAIAATGTFCVIASSQRPSSLTILPPINLILVAADRTLPTLADVIAAVGPGRFVQHRVALITGPSRTADIEKMIVIGVHGPKQLFAAVIA